MARKGLLVGLVVIGLTTMAGLYIGNGVAEKRDTFTVKRVALRRAVKGRGKVLPVNNETRLSFPISGHQLDLKVVEGAQVRKDQELARLNTTALDWEIAVSESKLKEARAQKAILTSSITPQVIQQAKEQISQAEFAEKECQIRLGQLESPAIPRVAPQWEIREAELDVEKAKRRFEEANSELKRLQAGLAPHEQAEGEIRLKIAQTNLDEAQKIFDAQIGKGGKTAADKPDEISLEMDLRRKHKAFELEQIRFEKLKAGAAAEAVDAAKARSEAARLDWEQVAAVLERLKNPPLPPKAASEAIALARNTWLGAQSAVREAKAKLDELMAGPRQEELEVQDQAIERAVRALALIQSRKDQAVLRAPFDGTIVKRFFEPGSAPPPFEPVLELADYDKVNVSAEFDVRYLPELQVGQNVEVTCKPIVMDPVQGRIVRIDQAVDRRSLFTDDPSEFRGGEVLKVAIELTGAHAEKPEVQARFLRPGLRVDVDIQLKEMEEVVCVPRRFVFLRKGKYVVYLAEDRNAEVESPYKLREVQFGSRDDRYVQILSGLVEGDIVVQPAEGAEEQDQNH